MRQSKIEDSLFYTICPSQEFSWWCLHLSSRWHPSLFHRFIGNFLIDQTWLTLSLWRIPRMMSLQRRYSMLQDVSIQHLTEFGLQDKTLAVLYLYIQPEDIDYQHITKRNLQYLRIFHRIEWSFRWKISISCNLSLLPAGIYGFRR